MPFTSSDLAVIDAAIASGTLSVRFADGRMVTYHSLDALLRARAVIAAELAGAGEANPAASRRGFAVFRA